MINRPSHALKLTALQDRVYRVLFFTYDNMGYSLPVCRLKAYQFVSLRFANDPT